MNSCEFKISRTFNLETNPTAAPLSHGRHKSEAQEQIKVLPLTPCALLFTLLILLFSMHFAVRHKL